MKVESPRPVLELLSRPQIGPAPIRALLVIPSAGFASAYIFSRRQAAMLQRVNVEVKVFHLESRTSPGLLSSAWRELRSQIRQWQPDVVHAQYGTMTAFLAGVATATPLVVTFRGSDLNPVPSISPWRERAGHLLSQLAALRAQGVICVSQGLRNRLWLAGRRARVIVGGVNPEVFFPRPRAEARAELGWPLDETVIAFNAGRHEKIKRLDLAEAAMRELSGLVSGARLEIFRGDVEPDRMPLYLSAADCLLVTSDWEGSPTIVKEAMACGLPVVSVEAGDVAERLNGVRPSCIAAREPRALAQAMAAVLREGRRSNGPLIAAELTEQEEVARIRRVYEAAMRRQ